MTGAEGRAYRREDLEAAAAAWADFADPIWRHVRELAASRGMIFPPSGTPWDEREDPKPSQRAIVYAALVDRPRATARIVAQARTWADVVRRILEDEAARRARGEKLDVRLDGGPSKAEAAAILADLATKGVH